MKMVQKAEGFIKATVADTKGGTDKYGRTLAENRPDLPVAMAREGASVKISFSSAVTEAWFNLYELQNIVGEMLSQVSKETDSYYGK